MSPIVNAQFVDRGYETRNLGSNEEIAKARTCETNVSSLGSFYRVNVISTSSTAPLQTNRLYRFINDDDNVRYLYITKVTNYISDRDSFNQNRFTRISIFCDNDNDGIENHIDPCPNEAGPASNNGCPGNPNLSIDMEASRVFSNCQTCSPSLDLFFQNNQRHIIQDGSGSITFNNLEIRNIGNIVSNTSKVNFYISINNELDQNDELLSAKDIPFRSVNQSYGVDLEITGWDIENVDFTTGNQYILIQLDPHNTNNEGSTGENDNLLAMPIRYQKSSGNIIYPSGKTFDLTKLQVFSLSGIKVLEKQVSTKEEENALLNQLPKGLYIVKKGEKTYKVAN